MKIILASTSPRRQALLTQIGLPHEVIGPSIDESNLLERATSAEGRKSGAVHGVDIETVARGTCTLAQAKARQALQVLSGTAHASMGGQHEHADRVTATDGLVPTTGKASEDCVVVACDTVVECDSQILNKPTNAADARRMLRLLSGRAHRVVTGVHVCRLSVTPAATGATAQGAATGAWQCRERTAAEITWVFFRELSDDLIERYIETGEPFDKAGSYGIQERGAVLVERIEGCYYNVVGLPVVLLARLLEDVGHTLTDCWT